MTAHIMTSTVVKDFVHYLYCVFETQTMKPFTVPEMTFNDHSRSSAMSSFLRSPGLSNTDWKSRLYLSSEKIAKMTLKVTGDATVKQDTYHFL